MKEIDVCYLMQSRLNPFLGEAIKTLISMINFSPKISLDFYVPEKVWKERCFLCILKNIWLYSIYTFFSKDERSKFDSKTKHYIFLGFEDDEFVIDYEIQKRRKLLEVEMLSSLKIKSLKTLNRKRK